ncbi:Hok/Gef family protein [Scandinavium goeteborgense]|uniref:Hok/Gef family protein n=1 Tax=Scandinavium goeteborgense TaxID=1851514 RepID=UPI0038188309
MKLPRSTLIWCVLLVCLPLLIFTYLIWKSPRAIHYRDTNREAVTFMACESAK